MTVTATGDIRTIVREAQSIISNRVEVAGKDASMDANADAEGTHAPPRFVLFHFPVSVCSEKVRTVLEESGFSYTSHELNPSRFYEELLHPAYVALRIQAWNDMGNPPLAGEKAMEGGDSEWSGGTSVSAEGLDLMVVPTLVDMGTSPSDTPKVVVDSEVICNYIADITEEGGDRQPLKPKAHLSLIEKYMKLVDETPHLALLYDGNPVKDGRPFYVKKLVRHENAIPLIERRLSEKGITWDGDPLERAYRAKLTLKLRAVAASEDTKGTESAQAKSEYLSRALEKTFDVLTQLESDLARRSGDKGKGWICGQQLTLADLVMAVNLHRLNFLGMSWMWSTTDYGSKFDLPNVASYAARCFALPSLQKAVIFYPGALPNRPDTEIFRRHLGYRAAFRNERRVDAMNSMFWLSNVAEALAGKSPSTAVVSYALTTAAVITVVAVTLPALRKRA